MSISVSMTKRCRVWTLTAAARLLEEPQHRLIYLCEKGVVQPEIQDASGRGSSRRFSARNLLELAVALRLRDLEIRASLVAAVVHVLKVFERKVAASIPGFALPASLQAAGSPDLRVVISDGRKLYFVLRDGSSPPRVFGGLDIRALESSGRAPRRLDEAIGSLSPGGSQAGGGEFGAIEGSRHVRVEVSITRIAQDLRLGA